MRVIVGDPDPKHVAYVRQILGILNHQLVGSGVDATWMLTFARQAKPDIAIVYAHFNDIKLGRTVQSLFQNGYVQAVIVGAKAPISEIELINTMPRTTVVMRPFTVQKMAEAIALVTGTPVPVARPAAPKPGAPAAPAAAPKPASPFERPSFVR